MNYISLDIETTGIDENIHSILEIGAVFEDTSKKLSFEEIPKFQCIIDHKQITGDVIALDINQRIIKILADYHKMPHPSRQEFAAKYNIYQESVVSNCFYNWLTEVYPGYREGCTVNIAGKNFGAFDNQFLKKFPSW